MLNRFWAPFRAFAVAALLLATAASAQDNGLANSHRNPEQFSILATKAAATKPAGDDRSAGALVADQAVRLNNIAVRLARVHSYPEAVDNLLQAVELDPALSLAYLNLSVVYDRMDRTADALGAARRALEIDPQNRIAHRQVCELLVLEKQLTEAGTCYQEMQTSGPLDQTSLANYFLVLLKTDNTVTADSIISLALQQAPSDPVLLNGLGLLRYKQKKYDEAVAALKQATEIKPDMGEARFNLALAQMAKSNRAGAISQYRLLEESDPKLAADLYRLLYKDQILYVGGKREH